MWGFLPRLHTSRPHHFATMQEIRTGFALRIRNGFEEAKASFSAHPWSCSCGWHGLSALGLQNGSYVYSCIYIYTYIYTALGLPPLRGESESLKQPLDLPLALIKRIYTIIIMSHEWGFQESRILPITAYSNKKPYPRIYMIKEQHVLMSWSYQMSPMQATISSCWFHSVLIMEKHNTSVYQCHICKNKNEIETTKAKFLFPESLKTELLPQLWIIPPKSSTSDSSLPKSSMDSKLWVLNINWLPVWTTLQRHLLDPWFWILYFSQLSRNQSVGTSLVPQTDPWKVALSPECSAQKIASSEWIMTSYSKSVCTKWSNFQGFVVGGGDQPCY